VVVEVVDHKLLEEEVEAAALEDGEHLTELLQELIQQHQVL
tara:strand:+ start:123 stop:245 length:123 start_codon:yes stop_codon:yes gene_type:complete